jgi:DNA-binding transcriptional LysR family regulator
MVALDPRLSADAFRFCTDSLPAQVAAVLAGVGLGVLQKPQAMRFSQLVEVPLNLKIPDMPVWLAMHEDMRDAAIIRAGMKWAETAIRRYVEG